jgi:hypothetical protein
MDATDDLTVRAAVAVIAWIGVIGWAIVYRFACQMRQGRSSNCCVGGQLSVCRMPSMLARCR